jgi:hypothetical protein
MSTKPPEWPVIHYQRPANGLYYTPTEGEALRKLAAHYGCIAISQGHIDPNGQCTTVGPLQAQFLHVAHHSALCALLAAQEQNACLTGETIALLAAEHVLLWDGRPIESYSLSHRRQLAAFKAALEYHDINAACPFGSTAAHVFRKAFEAARKAKTTPTESHQTPQKEEPNVHVS